MSADALTVGRIRRSLSRLHSALATALVTARYLIERAALHIPGGPTLYYALLSRAFAREHRAVLAGKVGYYRIEVVQARGMYRLRRNIHRLEKGLVMRPRRAIFAEDYIRETVLTYERLISEQSCESNPSLEWAHDVLQEYFSSVGGAPAIDKARVRFQATHPLQAVRSNGSRVPYLRDLQAPAPVDFDAFMDLSRRRRSVRWFLSRMPERELLDRAIAVAAQAPSACNRQPLQFRIYDEPERVRRIAALPLGTPGYRDNIPAIVAVVGRLDAFYGERDRHLIYIDGGLMTMAFIYALETLGLASCCINWPDVGDLEARMASLLGLEACERVVMLIAVGYPDPAGLVAYSGKKDVNELRSYNS